MWEGNAEVQYWRKAGFSTCVIVSVLSSLLTWSQELGLCPSLWFPQDQAHRWMLKKYLRPDIWKVGLIMKEKVLPDRLKKKKKPFWGTSPVIQWIRIHLPVEGTRVQSLDQEDSTCLGATKPMCHNYWAHWSPWHLEPVLHNKTSHHSEKAKHCSKE